MVGWEWAMVRVGTSGFSYDDWHPRFYPTELPSGRRLAYYAERFGCVEVNSTYYRQPTESMCRRLAATVGPEFRFAVKAYGGITHDWQAATAADFRRFAAALEPLREAGQLGCVLAQFPNAFRPGKAETAHLRRLREQWTELPLAVEFRHVAWDDERAFELLRRHGLAFCCVDQPALDGLMPPVCEVTARLAYLRFHGRNAARWNDHEEAWERYDYLYSPDELEPWTARIKELAQRADEVYVFFNNHRDAQAVQNARELAEQLAL